MKKLIFNTSGDWSPLFVRALLGLVFFAHGGQKLLGWFGGYGFEGTMLYFTDTVGLPWIVGFAVIIIEFFGSLALIVGWATRLWSIAFVFLNLGIILTSHKEHFFMNWFGNYKAEGYEFFLLAIGMSLSLVFSGAGKFSFDQKLSLQPAGSNSASNIWISDQQISV